MPKVISHEKELQEKFIFLKTNISPENKWLEDEHSFGNGPFSWDIR